MTLKKQPGAGRGSERWAFARHFFDLTDDLAYGITAGHPGHPSPAPTTLLMADDPRTSPTPGPPSPPIDTTFTNSDSDPDPDPKEQREENFDECKKSIAKVVKNSWVSFGAIIGVVGTMCGILCGMGLCTPSCPPENNQCYSKVHIGDKCKIHNQCINSECCGTCIERLKKLSNTDACPNLDKRNKIRVCNCIDDIHCDSGETCSECGECIQVPPIKETDNSDAASNIVGLDLTEIMSPIKGPDDSNFGYRVSFDMVGDRLAISSSTENLKNGTVRVYDISDLKAKQIGETFHGSEKSKLRGKLSLNGRRLIVGSPFHSEKNTSEVGRVQVYELSKTETHESWIPVGGPIYGIGKKARAGYAMGISADGNIIVVGMPKYSSEPEALEPNYLGAFQAFKLEKNVWKKMGQLQEGSTEGQRMGWSVEVSDDGLKLIVGSQEQVKKATGEQEAGSFAVFEYIKSTNKWDQLGQSVPGVAGNNIFASRVGMSANGFIVAGGAPRNSDNLSEEGHVRVFEFAFRDNHWKQKGNTINGGSQGAHMAPLALSSDGSRIAVSAPGSLGGKGLAIVYGYDTQSDKWVGGQPITGLVPGSDFGRDIDMTRDGKSRVAIGSAGVAECRIFQLSEL